MFFIFFIFAELVHVLKLPRGTAFDQKLLVADDSLLSLLTSLIEQLYGPSRAPVELNCEESATAKIGLLQLFHLCVLPPHHSNMTCITDIIYLRDYYPKLCHIDNLRSLIRLQICFQLPLSLRQFQLRSIESQMRKSFSQLQLPKYLLLIHKSNNTLIKSQISSKFVCFQQDLIWD